MLKLLFCFWALDRMVKPSRSVCSQLASKPIDPGSAYHTPELADRNASYSFERSLFKFSIHINTCVPLELSPKNCHLTKAWVRETQKQAKQNCPETHPLVWQIRFSVIKLDLCILKSNLSKLDLCLCSLMCSQPFLLGISAFANKSLNFCFTTSVPFTKHAVIGLIAKANKSIPWPFYLPIFRASAKIQSRANSLKRIL